MTTESIKRRLRLSRKLTPGEFKQLQEQPGVIDVRDGRSLELRYSPLQMDIDTLVSLLQDWRAGPRISRWRMQWYRFTEANAKDHLQHRPACCNRAPGGERK